MGRTQNRSADGRVRVHSPTELVNPRTTTIDQVSTWDALAMLNAEDLLVASAVTPVLPDLARVVDEAADRVRAGGRVHYFGAGTSGRLAVLDAAELLPTFGLGDVVIAHQAGGPAALVEAVEDAEDSERDGADAAAMITAADLVIGLTASGQNSVCRWRAAGGTRGPGVHGAHDVEPRARAVRGQRRRAGRRHGTGGDHRLHPPEGRHGAEAHAQRLLDGADDQAGPGVPNLMIDMQATNAKLRGRSIELLAVASGFPEQDCARRWPPAGT